MTQEICKLKDNILKLYKYAEAFKLVGNYEFSARLYTVAHDLEDSAIKLENEFYNQAAEKVKNADQASRNMIDACLAVTKK